MIWDKKVKDTVEGLNYIKTEGDFQLWSIGSGDYNIKIVTN